MDAELAAWQADGQRFDYLGFEVFHRVEGSGEPLLLVHGYPFSSFDWIKIWPTLTSRFNVIAPDMLGMGFSDKPTGYDYTVHHHADMHEALLAHLGVSECRILAHDLGDSVVQEMLARHESGSQSAGPLQIKSITWLNGGLFYETYRPRLVQKLLSASPAGGAISSLVMNGRFGSAILERTVREVFGPDTQPSSELLARFAELMDYNDGRRVTHLVGRFVVDRLHHRDRWVAAMLATDVPMRLIDGPYDPNSGRHLAERYREVIPDADVVLLGDLIGHWPQIEDPAGVLRHFLEFVSE